MYTQTILAAGALLSLVAAVPMAKRDIVWVTETDEATVTVPVTTTIWVNAGESVPATSAASTTSSVSHFGHHRSHSTSTVHSTVTVSAVVSSVTSVAAPATTSSSVYVAPTTPSSSVYVAPTTSTSVYVAPTTSTPVYVAPTTSTSIYVAPTTSTSVYVAPTTSTSVYVAPTTSAAASSITLSTYVAAASSTAAATTAAAASGTTPAGAAYTGDITHYDVGEGSCGWTNSNSEAVVAIPHGMMNNGANPNNNPLCGQFITISYAGATTQAKIVDTCGGCDGAAIDLSPTLFTTVAPSGDGRVHGVEWWFDGSA
ncbi:hypothetical protein LTR91_002085 [Friedmanniomyces endolithicus]|uniref:RlpA-like protein double-psi beta-barrel domain-containing protein n=1 Tax=Friedmanniomyces endolithicus TaxID=329885 RepID=A0AAN6KZJ2_9PEZI|nr:hypothetical protein LTR35_013413 [Friedmanniomyces endolithicus]KAK0298100.1 hypothetical protein LTS00_003064 [Friedmanniomyces endolithicus]KAK0324014.1 hypothetical protein LTR82_005135 [Friedmanniomyces endolithicus]KAK0926592.1 hypothetical protein LTR57_004047 [Friedmanniomyces endolithicus]KAK0993891.1 hypothetical protein LTS01_007308 [Friedmanniomyces endolithicus]